jgi:hypothetical protein
MEGVGKPHTAKNNEITNNWNNDISCMLTLLLDLDLENCKHLVFVEQSVHAELSCSKIELLK